MRPGGMVNGCTAMTEVTPTMFCLKCDYVLDGLRDRRCPECGQSFDPADSASFHSLDRPTPPPVGLRRVHEVSLLIVGIIFLDRIVTNWLRPVWDILGKRYADEVLTCVLMIGASASVVCGVLLVRHHRRDARLLPVRSYLTYLASTIIWSYLLMVVLHNWLGLHNGAYLAVWLGPVLLHAVPWIIFRFRKPPPVLVDAVLCSLIVVVVLQLLIPQPSPGFSPLQVLWDESEVGFAVLVAVQFLMLLAMRKRGLHLLVGLTLRILAIIVLVLIIFLLMPRVVA